MSERPVNARFTHAQRKVLAELAPKLADKLLLDATSTRTLGFTEKELETIQERSRAAIRKAETGPKRNSLRHINEITKKAIKQSLGIRAIPESKRLYQLKITLLGFRPLIWRRIRMKDCTLDKLHEHIQAAMGWTNSHLHHFMIDGAEFGDPQLLDGGLGDCECADSTATKLSEIVPEEGRRFQFLYEYDFGDSWEHGILFERCLRANPKERYPLCLSGARACPPEDVGGVWGYADFLDGLADPDDERHDEFVEWDGNFDPQRFDPKQATEEMRRGLPNWRSL